ncbi:MAG: hypothetical protein ACTSSE_15255 [Candidatus Thorarchaeota archaeon]
MQFFLNLVQSASLIGHILSIALVILFGVLYSKDRISITATAYSCGAFLAFEIGSIMFTVGSLIGLHSLIGLLGGYLLLGLSCIQAIYDTKFGKKQS